MLSLVRGSSWTSTNLLPFSTCLWGCFTCQVFKIHDLVPFFHNMVCAASTYECLKVFKGAGCIISNGVDNASACRHIRCRLGDLHSEENVDKNWLCIGCHAANMLPFQGCKSNHSLHMHPHSFVLFGLGNRVCKHKLAAIWIQQVEQCRMMAQCHLVSWPGTNCYFLDVCSLHLQRPDFLGLQN